MGTPTWIAARICVARLALKLDSLLIRGTDRPFAYLGVNKFILLSSMKPGTLGDLDEQQIILPVAGPNSQP
jgi:hypothetical protein